MGFMVTHSGRVASALDCPLHTAFSRLYAAREKVIAELGLTVPEEVWTR